MSAHEEEKPEPQNDDDAGPSGGEAAEERPKGAERVHRRRISWRQSAALCEEELSRVQAELAELQDRHLRLAAEYQNYRRRVEEEARTLRRDAQGRAFAELFPLFDLLDLALSASEQGGSLENLVAGLRMIEGQWNALLAGAGVTEIPAVGQAFDPTLHEAVQVVEEPELAPGRVITVVRKGYRLRDRVLRFARVVVSEQPRPPQGENAADPGRLSNGASPSSAPGGEDEWPGRDEPAGDAGDQAGEARED